MYITLALIILLIDVAIVFSTGFVAASRELICRVARRERDARLGGVRQSTYRVLLNVFGLSLWIENLNARLYFLSEKNSLGNVNANVGRSLFFTLNSSFSPSLSIIN